MQGYIIDKKHGTDGRKRSKRRQGKLKGKTGEEKVNILIGMGMARYTATKLSEGRRRCFNEGKQIKE